MGELYSLKKDIAKKTSSFTNFMDVSFLILIFFFRIWLKREINRGKGSFNRISVTMTNIYQPWNICHNTVVITPPVKVPEK